MQQSFENAKGIFFMLVAMATFAGGDVLIKMTGAFLSPAQTMFILISSGMVIFSIIAKMNGENLTDGRAFKPILLVRYTAEMVGLMAMIVSLNKVPLPIVGAVSQAAPILVAAGAVFFLKEVVSWRRWASIAIGFIGVLCVIQPGEEGFNVAVIWPVLALVAFSIRDLVTRLTPKDMSSASIATFTMLSALPFTTAWVLFNGELFIPPGFNWLLVACMVTLGQKPLSRYLSILDLVIEAATHQVQLFSRPFWNAQRHLLPKVKHHCQQLITRTGLRQVSAKWGHL